MHCCTPTCQKWTVLGFGAFFLILGLVLVLFTDDIVQAVKDKELNLGSKDTTEYKMWVETPIPMYLEIHLFNWNNSQEVLDSKWTKKPSFNEMGPYVFSEKHYRKEVVLNNNHTLTYKTQRIWKYIPEMSSGSLENDEITTLNPILATVVNFVRFKHSIVKMGVNFFLEEKKINLTVTKKAHEFIFDGYDDPLLDLFKKLHLHDINLPFKEFAWFAERNGNVDFDGIYNMYDGTDDVRKLGRFAWWNYESRSKYFSSYCGDVNGTSGELWYPVQDDESVDIFAPDLCSTITLFKNGTDEKHGVQGNKYIATERLFDNGSAYPEMACFSLPGEVVPSGVRNVSSCKFGAPAFFSLPHFYLADPSYREAIDGMKPNASEHEFFVSIEPETGIPIQARVAAQISLLLRPIDKIKLLKNVKKIFMPALWFKEYAILSDSLASQAKLLIVLPSVGLYTGWGVIGIGCLLLFVFGFITWKSYWKGREEERLLNQEVF